VELHQSLSVVNVRHGYDSQFRKDAKLAVSIGLVLGWVSWQALVTGTFAGFALAAVYGGVRLATHQVSRTSQLPLGPFILLGSLAALALSRV
jgi:leader peptidase (prepilin peptidase)/N-methyltransferase